MNAMIHIENAIMDDAIGRVIDHLEEKGWLEDTDIIFTPDHGGMDGDSGLMLIGLVATILLMRNRLLYPCHLSAKAIETGLHFVKGILLPGVNITVFFNICINRALLCNNRLELNFEVTDSLLTLFNLSIQGLPLQGMQLSLE